MKNNLLESMNDFLTLAYKDMFNLNKHIHICIHANSLKIYNNGNEASLIFTLELDRGLSSANIFSKQEKTIYFW